MKTPWSFFFPLKAGHQSPTWSYPACPRRINDILLVDGDRKLRAKEAEWTPLVTSSLISHPTSNPPFLSTLLYLIVCLAALHFPGGSDGKASVYNEGDLGSIPGSGRFRGEGNGNPLQYSCLENPMDGGAWCRLLSMGRKKSGTTDRLHFHFHFWLHWVFVAVDVLSVVGVSRSCPPVAMRELLWGWLLLLHSTGSRSQGR